MGEGASRINPIIELHRGSERPQQIRGSPAPSLGRGLLCSEEKTHDRARAHQLAKMRENNQ